MIAYRRSAAGDERAVVVNFTEEAVTVDIGRDLTVEVASDGAGEGTTFTGEVGPSQALILR